MSVSTPFSLHCSICIEAFDRKERPPVVLPCGHTFICRICAKKLTHCAICRISLFRTPEHRPRPSSRVPRATASPYSPNRLSTYSPSRASPSRTPTKQQSPSIKEPLPIPKNLVLLSLMELSFVGPPSISDEENEVIQSINILKGAAGTYAVRASDGVDIFPTKLDALNGDKENGSTPARSAAKSDKSSQLDHVTFDERNTDELHGEDSHRRKNSASSDRVARGCTLQVVEIEDEIATLARNRGFVRVDELAKIGAPTDKACILEAQLAAIGERKQELLDSLHELDVARSLSALELEKELLDTKGGQFGHVPLVQRNEAGPSEVPFDEQEPTKKQSLNVVPLGTSSGPVEHHTRVFPRIESLTSNMTRDMDVDNEIVSPSFGCSEVILPFLCTDDDFVVTNPAPVSPSPQNSTGPNARQDSVNFRTGLSGHMALGSSSSRSDRLHLQRSEIRMMGEHRGAGSVRRIVQRSASDASVGSPTNSTHSQQGAQHRWVSYLRQTRSSETT